MRVLGTLFHTYSHVHITKYLTLLRIKIVSEISTHLVHVIIENVDIHIVETAIHGSRLSVTSSDSKLLHFITSLTREELLKDALMSLMNPLQVFFSCCLSYQFNFHNPHSFLYSSNSSLPQLSFGLMRLINH